ncbi:hypothetical protein KVR01_010178 [Diaporthe batatas]|uniref:uncharacterized protein n=1 Tax=Diaporthe batatas TaxID=748121 RepID=UPI001D049510|nr:uncharacterized protein KVR01_010178 [Diaporthe batatas]KAG8159541.1 hypothetical protein KVR01_010178 [Diaporthe batatas]
MTSVLANMVDTAAFPSSEDITLQEFRDALAEYDQLIEAVSAAKGAKPGQKTLKELDQYRYVEAPALFAPTTSRRPMQLGDVQALVEWKLKHGKFRPTLMKLVSSNDQAFVRDSAETALDIYSKNPDASAAIDALTKLKGIGPATASLLLAVHDPQNVIFFADEAFYWLCSHGKRDHIKYSAKEYRQLLENSQKLARRLSVKAIDIERVAYVLLNKPASSLPSNSTKPSADTPNNAAAAPEQTTSTASKRKQEGVIEASSAPRRSKRSRRP